MNKKVYIATLEKINEILISSDPLGLIQIGAPKNEYNSLAEDIILLLKKPHTLDSLTEDIFKMFVEEFDLDTTGNKAKYKNIAEEVNKFDRFT